MKLWLDGRLEAATSASIRPGDRGLLLGDGLYETLLVRGGQPLRLAAHLRRLAQGAAVLRLPLPELDLGAALAATLAANDLAAGSLRLTLTRGSGPRGLAPPAEVRPTLLITAAPASAPPPPARGVIARSTCRNERSPLAGVKSLNCLDAILARLEAAERGADEAILLNTAGRVAEATAANLFAVIGGRLLTPPLAEGALPGVMRAAILESEGSEAPLTPADLAGAEELFLTSSLSIRPLASLEGRALATRDGATAARLAARLIPPA